MQFGLVLPTYSQSANTDGIATAAREAEQLGFTSVWSTDHIVLPPGEVEPYSLIFEAVTTLAYVAGITKSIRLGTSVLIAPQRNSIVMAKQLATLDQLCGGRLIAGVGAGWHGAEFSMLGHADRFGIRGAYLDEVVQLWQHLWTDPGQDFQGEFHQLPPTDFAPLPVQTGGPPLWIGGSSIGARRRAGRFGTVWHPSGLHPHAINARQATVLSSAQKHKRPAPKTVPRILLNMNDSKDEITVQYGRLSMFTAGPEGMIRHLKTYQVAGVEEVVCAFHARDNDHFLEQAGMFATEVMPTLLDENMNRQDALNPSGS